MKPIHLHILVKSTNLSPSTKLLRICRPPLLHLSPWTNVSIHSKGRFNGLSNLSLNVFSYSSWTAEGPNKMVFEMPKNPFGSLSFFVALDWDMVQFVREHQAKAGKNAGSPDDGWTAFSRECERRQREVVQMLDKLGFQERHVPSQDRHKKEPTYQPMFNLIWVQGASEELRQKIVTLPGVVDCFADGKGRMVDFVDEELTYVSDLSWSLKTSGAAEIWRKGYMGQGILVGVIDSGVQANHEALKENFLGAKIGWFDAVNGMKEPEDHRCHGTAVAAIAVGRKGVGIAPLAHWMAANCTNSKGEVAIMEVIACLFFMLNSKGERGGVRPNVINISLVLYDFTPLQFSYLRQALALIEEKGILVVAAVGNEGPFCHTSKYPANFQNVLAVGAICREWLLCEFSSSGPSPEKVIKPDLVAPGKHVYSATASRESTSKYGYYSGTSIACPFVTGVATLLLSRRPDLEPAQIQKILIMSTEIVSPAGRRCGGFSDSVHPNNSVGYGRINALKAFSLMEKIHNLEE